MKKLNRILTQEEQAHARIDEMGFTDEQQDFIFSDWDNQTEHIDWLLTASKTEITNWGEAANWGQA